jgi:hypothetical protein
MWEYQQHDGELLRGGMHQGWGYSGAGVGKNNPEMQYVHDVGPIPRGLWVIGGPPTDTLVHGPYVLTLTPTVNVEVHGRVGFLIHGDSIVAPGTASLGCVVLARFLRQMIWNSDDREFMVEI